MNISKIVVENDLIRLDDAIKYNEDLNQADEFSKTLLHHAAIQGKHLIITYLPEERIDTNRLDDQGYTALHYAVGAHKNALITTQKILSFKYINVNKTNKLKRIALHEAVLKNADPKIIKALLKAGSKVNAKDSMGNTPLDIAEKGIYVNPQTITILKKHGAVHNTHKERLKMLEWLAARPTQKTGFSSNNRFGSLLGPKELKRYPKTIK